MIKTNLTIYKKIYQKISFRHHCNLLNDKKKPSQDNCRGGPRESQVIIDFAAALFMQMENHSQFGL